MDMKGISWDIKIHRNLTWKATNQRPRVYRKCDSSEVCQTEVVFCNAEEKILEVQYMGVSQAIVALKSSKIPARFPMKMYHSHENVGGPVSSQACQWPPGISLISQAQPSVSTIAPWIGNVMIDLYYFNSAGGLPFGVLWREAYSLTGRQWMNSSTIHPKLAIKLLAKGDIKENSKEHNHSHRL